jgi:hypothetical protein
MQLPLPYSARASGHFYSLSARPGTFRRASGSDRSSSPATGMGSRGGSALGIVAPGVWASAWGCSFVSDATPPPPALDIADDGLTALVNVNVLNSDLLLALAAVAVESIEQCRIGAGELVRLAQSFLSALEALVADHGPPVAFHRGVVGCDKLRGYHALKLVSWLDTDQRIDCRMALPPDFIRI